MYNDIKLDNGLYHLSGKTFSEALESMDNSINYANTPLANTDAYERQLLRFNINTESDKLNKFYVTTESSVLLPEYIKRKFVEGFNESCISKLYACKSHSESSSYTGAQFNDSAAYGTTNESLSMAAATITEQTSAISLLKYGRCFNISYEALREQSIGVIGTFIKSSGHKLANSVVSNAITTLTEGISPITATSLTEDDVIKLLDAFTVFEANTLIVPPSLHGDILKMSVVNNKGIDVVVTSSAPAKKIIAINNKYALEMVTTPEEIIIEADKITNRQLDTLACAIRCGFRQLMPDFIKVLSITS